jgi:hypothetical protein
VPPLAIQNKIHYRIVELKNEVKALRTKAINKKDFAIREFENEIF